MFKETGPEPLLAALRESEARFRNMADSAPVVMWVTDPSGYCTHLNRRWYEFTGQAPGAGEGYGWLDAVHPEDRSVAEQAFVAANARQEDYRVDFRLRRADGVYRWTIDAAAARFADDGVYLGYVGSVIDIDERREAENRLAVSEELLRLATEAAEIGLWDVDLTTNAMFWPPRVKAMFGISPDVPVTLDDYYDGVHPDDREATLAAFAAACDPAQRLRYDVEYRTVGKEDGIVRWVAAKGTGVFTEEGECKRVLGTAIDITPRKQTEARLKELNETLEQQVATRTAERNRVWEMSRDLFAIMGFDGRLKRSTRPGRSPLDRTRKRFWPWHSATRSIRKTTPPSKPLWNGCWPARPSNGSRTGCGMPTAHGAGFPGRSSRKGRCSMPWVGMSPTTRRVRRRYGFMRISSSPIPRRSAPLTPTTG